MIPPFLVDLAGTWVAGAVGGAHYLARLYRLLDDDRQAVLAFQAGNVCEQWIKHLSTTGPMTALLESFPSEPTEDVQGEAQAWFCLVEANAAILVLHSLVDSASKDGRTLRGSRTAATKAFQRALQGYRAAFPEEVAEPGIQRAIESVALNSADALARMARSCTVAEQKDLDRYYQQIILDALAREAATPQRADSA